MPLLVVGADHPLGAAIVSRTVHPEREVRAYVSDPESAANLKAQGAKVAVGDLSDEGHIAAAATRCFSIAFVIAALDDGRELAFADRDASLAAWARAAEQSGVTRVIWVGEEPPTTGVDEVALVGGSGDPIRIADQVAEIDDRATL